MTQVNIIIAKRGYQVTCDDGQEAQLVRLSRFLDQRASQLAAAVGAVPEPLLLVMVGLLVADELAEARAEIEAARAEVPARDSAVVRAMAEDVAAERIEKLAQRIETLADRLE
ncbi:MAG: cell division protein ZapA [Alphaproteobacteria bacterium]|nr:cell division protein ZapA [Alphaproteobacteria bacterium]